jgi:hypothetical protein
VSDEWARRRRYRNLDAAYIEPYEIKRIGGPNLEFISKFEVCVKELLCDQGAQRGRSSI